jgi:hypothetical protein
MFYFYICKKVDILVQKVWVVIFIFGIGNLCSF